MLTKTANDKTSSDSNAFEYFYPEFLFLGNHPQIRCVSVFPPRRLGIKQIFHSWIIRRIPRTVFRSGFFFPVFFLFFWQGKDTSTKKANNHIWNTSDFILLSTCAPLHHFKCAVYSTDVLRLLCVVLRWCHLNTCLEEQCRLLLLSHRWNTAHHPSPRQEKYAKNGKKNVWTWLGKLLKVILIQSLA